jgi:hypothetical protein
MIRRISYRSATTAFVFTGFWFVLGLLLLWSPIPGALGIRAHMFIAWLALFLLMLAGSGAMLTMASFNGIFPPRERPRPPKRPAPTATATHTADGQPQPWSQSPLPERPARRALSSTAARPRGPEPPARQGR